MDFGKTLNLPKTAFPMKANLPVKEVQLLKKWEEIDIYKKITEKNKDKTPFVMHDGPPYANGRLHDGHVLNKILKDITVKYKNMSGFLTFFRPGWDCHGLPIELKVQEKLKKKKKHLNEVDFLKECRNFAKNTVEIQKEEFKRLGVFADWDKPYLTMNKDYEGAIAHQFAEIAKSGAIFKSKKPVYWCHSCETALAEAEVEYAEHKSPSIFVKFPLIDTIKELENEKVNMVIWTTTPWTLPANLGIALNPSLEYVAVKYNNEIFIIAEARREFFLEAVNQKDAKIVAKFDAKTFEGMNAQHPFIDRKSKIVYADYVTTDAGTGCVHTAPGHGQDDYITGLKNGLEVYAPVDNKGRFTEDVPFWAKEHVFKANPKIVQHLYETGYLLNKPGEEITHSYPHCWRCHKPLIFRGTEQWFVSMDKTNLRDKCLTELEKTELIPQWGRKRIVPMIENGPDWCISRQRLWGVPITSFECEECGEKILDSEISHKVADIFAKEGIEAWHTHDISKFLPKDYKCPKCGSTHLKKGKDILDVWFDSGVSWAAVLNGEKGFEYPADLYLEGSDQHRGWFQSSLKLSVLINGKAPYKSVLTHGFVVDGKGEKLSKSKGNFTPPDKRINQLGAEILRLWVSGEDYRDDIRVSDEIIKSFTIAYRKIRNTIRFMFGFINDFNPENSYKISDLSSIDRWAIAKWKETAKSIIEKYETYEYHKIYHKLLDFLTVDMSASFLDVIKDRYVMHKDDEKRRKTQFAVYSILKELLIIGAPIFSFTAEEAYSYLPGEKKESIFLENMPQIELSQEDKTILEKWETLFVVRTGIQKKLEELRANKTIGLSLDAKVKIYWENLPILDEEFENLESIFIVSKIEKTDNKEGLIKLDEELNVFAKVEKAVGEKCPRCWKIRELKDWNEEIKGVCESCYKVLSK